MSGCADFQENAWRKDLCSNCLKHRQLHAVTTSNIKLKPPALEKPQLSVKPARAKEPNLSDVKPKENINRLSRFNKHNEPKSIKPKLSSKPDILIVEKSTAGVSENKENATGHKPKNLDVYLRDEKKRENDTPTTIDIRDNSATVSTTKIVSAVKYELPTKTDTSVNLDLKTKLLRNDKEVSRKSKENNNSDHYKSPVKHTQNSIEKSQEDSNKKERKRSVGFASDQPVIIGYDGGVHSYSDEEDEGMEDGDSPRISSPLTEEEKEFAAVTFENTKWNMDPVNLTKEKSPDLSPRSKEFEDIHDLLSSGRFKNYENHSSKIYGTFPTHGRRDKPLKTSLSAMFRSNPLEDLRRTSAIFKDNKGSVESSTSSQDFSDHYKTPVSSREMTPDSDKLNAVVPATTSHYKTQTSSRELTPDPEYFVLDPETPSSPVSSPMTGTMLDNWSMRALSPTELLHQEVPVELYHLRTGPRPHLAKPYKVVDVAPADKVLPYTIVDVSASLPEKYPDALPPALPTTPAPGTNDRPEFPPQKSAKTSPAHKTASASHSIEGSPVHPSLSSQNQPKSESDKNGIYEPVGEARNTEAQENICTTEDTFTRDDVVRQSGGKTPAFAAKMAAIACNVDFGKSKQKRHAPSPPSPGGATVDDSKIKPPPRKQKFATRLNSQQNYTTAKEHKVGSPTRPCSPPLISGNDGTMESFSINKENKSKKAKFSLKKFLKFNKKDSDSEEMNSNPGTLSPEQKYFVESWLNKSLEEQPSDSEEEVFSNSHQGEGQASPKTGKQEKTEMKDISSPLLLLGTSRIEITDIYNSDSQVLASKRHDVLPQKLYSSSGALKDGQSVVATELNNAFPADSSQKTGKKSPIKRPPPPPPPPASAKPSIAALRASVSDNDDAKHDKSANFHDMESKISQKSKDSNTQSTGTKLKRGNMINGEMKKPQPPPPPKDIRSRSSTLGAIPVTTKTKPKAPQPKPFRASTTEVQQAKNHLSKHGRSNTVSEGMLPDQHNQHDDEPYDDINSADELDPDYPTIPPPAVPIENHYEAVTPPIITEQPSLQKENNVYDLVGASGSEANTASTSTSVGSTLEGYLEPVVTVTKDSMKHIEKQLKRHSREMEIAEAQSKPFLEVPETTLANEANSSDQPVPMPRKRSRSRTRISESESNNQSKSLETPSGPSNPYVLVWKKDSGMTQTTSESGRNEHGHMQMSEGDSINSQNQNLTGETKTLKIQDVAVNKPKNDTESLVLDTLHEMTSINVHTLTQLLEDMRYQCAKRSKLIIELPRDLDYGDFALIDEMPVLISSHAVFYRAVHKDTEKPFVLLISVRHSSTTAWSIISTSGTSIQLPSFTSWIPNDLIPIDIQDLATTQRNGDMQYAHLTVVPGDNVQLLDTYSRDIMKCKDDTEKTIAKFVLQCVTMFLDLHKKKCLPANFEDIILAGNSRINEMPVMAIGAQMDVQCSGLSTDNTFQKLMTELCLNIKPVVSNDFKVLPIIFAILSVCDVPNVESAKNVLGCYLWGPDRFECERCLKCDNDSEAVEMWIDVQRTKLIGEIALNKRNIDTANVKFVCCANVKEILNAMKVLYL